MASARDLGHKPGWLGTDVRRQLRTGREVRAGRDGHAATINDMCTPGPAPDFDSDFPREIPAPASYGGGSYTLANDAARGPTGGPAYLSPSGERVIPSGTLFVQFSPGIRAEDKASELAALGLRIVQVPGFAPHAAYVEGASLASTLAAARPLLRRAGVTGVEVQMKRAAERK